MVYFLSKHTLRKKDLNKTRDLFSKVQHNEGSKENGAGEKKKTSVQRQMSYLSLSATRVSFAGWSGTGAEDCPSMCQ